MSRMSVESLLFWNAVLWGHHWILCRARQAVKDRWNEIVFNQPSHVWFCKVIKMLNKNQAVYSILYVYFCFLHFPVKKKVKILILQLAFIAFSIIVCRTLLETSTFDSVVFVMVEYSSIPWICCRSLLPYW